MFFNILSSEYFLMLFIVIIFAIGFIFLLLLIRKKNNEIRLLSSKISRLQAVEESVFETKRDLEKTKLSNETLNNQKLNLSTRFILIEKFAQNINAHLDKKAVLNALLESLKRIFKAKKAEIFMFGSDKKLKFAAALGWEKEDAEIFKLSCPSAILEYISETSDILNINDINKDFHLSELSDKSKLKTMIAGSMVSPSTNEVIGVANISQLEENESILQEDNRALSILLNLTSLAMNNAELFQRTKMMANMDGLTKLYNHRYFQEFFRDELSRHARYKRSISIIISDIDHFKTFNDEYGHQAGDFVLKEVAKIFKSNIRKKIDLAARYGGEEFVIVLPETNASGALKLAERIRKIVEETKFYFKPLKESLHVTVSIGVANYPLNEDNPDLLIKCADAAMYKAKNSGRNKVCLAE